MLALAQCCLMGEPLMAVLLIGWLNLPTLLLFNWLVETLPTFCWRCYLNYPAMRARPGYVGGKKKDCLQRERGRRIGWTVICQTLPRHERVRQVRGLRATSVKGSRWCYLWGHCLSVQSFLSVVWPASMIL